MLHVLFALVVLAGTAVSSPSDTLSAKQQAILEESEGLRPQVLERALRAYQRATSAGLVRSRKLTIIDYELPSFEKRLWVIDMDTGRVMHEEWVAHGMGDPPGSGGTMTGVLSFSNNGGTRKSCLGLFITGESYTGKHGYSLRLDGREPGYNDNARRRFIVLHGAHYVSPDRAENRLMGRSWGCPAVRPKVSEELIDHIKDGSVLWVYYPDRTWLKGSRFLKED